jgi:hypothetical protein
MENQEQTPETTPETNQAEDKLFNFKKEVERKMGNLEQTNAQLAKLIETMTATAAQAKPVAAADTTNIKRASVFEDEEAYTRSILEEANNIVDKKLSSVQAKQTEQQTLIAALVADFPELNSSDHQLTKSAVETYNKLSDKEKASPIAYKLAVQQAALELGIKPKAKRSQDETDDFVIAGGSGAMSKKPRQNEMDERTLAFAQLMGLDTSKSEVKDRLKKRAARKTYNNWE